MTHVIAFDFEAAGGVPAKNGFTQLGAVLVDLGTDEVIASFNEYASMEGYEWEERCVREFWSKNPERYAETLAATSDGRAPGPRVVVGMFLAWAKRVSEGKEVYLITDCCAFDVGLLKHFASTDILYVFGECRDIVDVSSVYLGLSRRFLDLSMVDGSSKAIALGALNEIHKGYRAIEWPVFPVAHDHHPVNDATVIALRYAFVMRELTSR